MNSPRVMLIIDDISINREMLKEIFYNEYLILEAENGKQALTMVKQNISDIAVILVDLIMPEMDGFEFIEQMKHIDPKNQIPMVVITIADDSRNEVRALDMGASELIGKPFEPSVVRKRVHNVVCAYRSKNELEEISMDLSSRLQQSNAIMIDMLSSIVEHRSMEQNHHVIRLRKFTEIILKEMSKNSRYDLTPEKIEVIANASALHDIGKIIIPDAILNRKNGLSDDEYEIFKSHTTEGSSIIKQFGYVHQKDYIQYACEIAEFHHERFDGSGYPHGIRGNEIPVSAQAVGLADSYDSLTSGQTGGVNYTHQQALSIIKEGSRGTFSPDILAVLDAVAEQLFEVGQRYQDTEHDNESLSKNIRQVWFDMNMETYRLDYLKFMSLLRVMNCYAIEINPETGYYTTIYPKEPIFQKIAQEGDFQKAVVVLSEAYIHPSQKQLIQKNLQKFMEMIGSGNPIEQEYKYLLYYEEARKYEWFKVNLIRLTSFRSSSGNLLMIFRKIDREDCETTN